MLSKLPRTHAAIYLVSCLLQNPRKLSVISYGRLRLGDDYMYSDRIAKIE